MGVSDELYHFIHNLWLANQPIGELSWTLKSEAEMSNITKGGLTNNADQINKNEFLNYNDFPYSANYSGILMVMKISSIKDSRSHLVAVYTLNV